jgi:hypothetical protein
MGFEGRVDPTAVTSLLPLGGASALLIYLLRIWLTERQHWVDERTQLLEDFRQQQEDRDADQARHVNALRARIAELEGEADVMRHHIADLSDHIVDLHDKPR